MNWTPCVNKVLIIIKKIKGLHVNSPCPVFLRGGAILDVGDSDVAHAERQASVAINQSRSNCRSKTETKKEKKKKKRSFVKWWFARVGD